MSQVLYITYDGLTDPLGQSQILPYLKGLSKYGYKFTILSFEKKERLIIEREFIEQLNRESSIEWVPLSFTTKPPFLAKFYDAIRMKRAAVALHKTRHFSMVHCRSYIAADAGLVLKKRFGVKFFFDMRGFWADEKKDGSWNLSNPFYKKLYKYYKKKETEYLKNADQVIVLTNAARLEMLKWNSYKKSVPLEVIPCCADMKLFSLNDAIQKKQSRIALGINDSDFVLSYLGSIGTWYMLDEMLQFFKILKKRYQDAKFLFVTHSDKRAIENKLLIYGISKDDIIIKSASRQEVSFFIKSSDLNISFIKPVYSKISSSPTKLGEVLSMGIPVICNKGIGDVEEILAATGGGVLVNDFNDASFQKAVDSLPGLLEKNLAEIRKAAESIYSLDKGIEMYLRSYQNILNPR